MNSIESLEFAKQTLFYKMPEAIQLFDEDDATYFVYSEFANFIVANINTSSTIQKAVDLIKQLLEKNEETIETLIVIEVFQKLYPHTKVKEIFQNYLKGKALFVFEKYYFEWKKPYDAY